jgi:hypothetical protein
MDRKFTAQAASGPTGLLHRAHVADRLAAVAAKAHLHPDGAPAAGMPFLPRSIAPIFNLPAQAGYGDKWPSE